jgi:sec-independent protein translocase protein TatA
MFGGVATDMILPFSPLQIFRLGAPELIVVLLFIILLIWGPKNIPKLARALGLAKREFEEASKGKLEEEPEKEEDDLIKLAKELGIDTKGKSREEIKKEILEKTKKG